MPDSVLLSPLMSSNIINERCPSPDTDQDAVLYNCKSSLPHKMGSFINIYSIMLYREANMGFQEKKWILTNLKVQSKCQSDLEGS